jgi:ABC-type transport system involved in multi-copper enzyme maturation permease subunit
VTAPTSGPGALAAAVIQARWSALRMVRGRTIWLAWIFALLPIGFTLTMAQSDRGAPWHELFVPLVMLIGVLAPLFMASSMAEEIEDRTYTYLWSRPVPRWTIVVGKLMAAAPISGGILALSVAACFAFAEGGTPDQLARGITAALVGALAICGVAGGLAILIPRAGLVATYAYLLALDLPLGAIPFSLRNVSITHQIRQLAGVGGEGEAPVQAALWLLGIGGLWLVIGLWRLGRAEFSGAER